MKIFAIIWGTYAMIVGLILGVLAYILTLGTLKDVLEDFKKLAGYKEE